MKADILKGYIPGSIGRVVELHAAYYDKRAGFGLHFEGKVACGISEFLSRYDEGRDGWWLAMADGRVEGSIAIDGIHADNKGAHLRWFISSERVRGTGVGNALLTTALEFCRARHYERVYLWTFEGLDAARHLYEKHGFRLAEQLRGTQWGSEVNEQRFELPLSMNPNPSFQRTS